MEKENNFGLDNSTAQLLLLHFQTDTSREKTLYTTHKPSLFGYFMILWPAFEIIILCKLPPWCKLFSFFKLHFSCFSWCTSFFLVFKTRRIRSLPLSSIWWLLYRLLTYYPISIRISLVFWSNAILWPIQPVFNLWIFIWNTLVILFDFNFS